MESAIRVTKTVYTVADFVDWQRSGGLNLRPYFQRGAVWQKKAKSFLIDTLIRGFPIPIIYVQTRTDPNTKRTIRQVVDGQQRLRSILAYIDIDLLSDPTERDIFSIMKVHNPELAGTTFNDLSQDLRDRLMQTELSVHVLPESITDKTLLQLFARLNSTGVKLNDQELRNANFHGELKTLVYDLSFEQIDRWTEWGTFNPQALAQMKEVEFLSDIVAMLLDGPAARSKAGLDSLYNENDETFEEAGVVTSIVPKLFDEVDDATSGLDSGAFRKSSWLYTVFTLIAISRYGAPIRADETQAQRPFAGKLSQAQVQRAVRRADSSLSIGNIPSELAAALRGASTDRASREARLRYLLDHVER